VLAEKINEPENSEIKKPYLHCLKVVLIPPIFWKQTLDGAENRCRLFLFRQFVDHSVPETNSSFVLFNTCQMAV